jgi:uracil-DNA glycosylase
MRDSWKKIIESFNITASFTIQQILDIIDSNRVKFRDHLEIYPSNENIFKCFDYCDISEIKVVIIGQDPYHGPNQATGLSFAVKSETPMPPSLRNINNELRADIGIDLVDISLEHWAKQGVLLLNASLSVIQGKPGSQMRLWCYFTDYVISKLNEQENPIIFLAWGAFAHTKLSAINTEKHHVLVSSHPSPLSCYKNYKQFPAFKGSKPFSKINELLIKQNKQRIYW